MIFALCEGPIAGLGTVYKGGGLHAASEFFLGLFTGTTPQAPWGYLAASYPQAALGYQGTAFAASSFFDLGSSASIGSIAFEVVGRLVPSAALNAHDADPAEVIGDFLTNAQYGVGFPASSLDASSLFGSSGSASYQAYCQATGLAFSPALTSQETANAILSRWLQITNATAVWSGGRLKILPLGDAAVSGVAPGGAIVAFQPADVPVMDLDDDDFIHEDGADPVQASRSDPYAASNVQRLEVLDRQNQYSATPIEAHDQNAIETYGLRVGSTITAHEICDLGVGRIAAQLILQRGLHIRNTYTFRLSWDYCLLEPMDVVTLSDAGLGLSRTPVRIIAIDEAADGLLGITAEEYPGLVSAAPAYPVVGASGSPIDRNVVPAPVNPPTLFEPPAELSNGAAQVWIGLSGGQDGRADPNWGGAIVYVSTDDASYTQVGAVSGPARQGELTAALAAPSGGTPSDSLLVDLTMSAGSIAQVSGLTSLALVDGEILGFTSAALSGSSRYALGGLTRARYGQHGGAHAVGGSFVVLDEALFKYTLPVSLVGATLYLKFASVNMFGHAVQDLSTCVAYPFTPVGSGLFGPLASALAVGTATDEGQASATANETDDFGIASDPYTDVIDLGLVSDGAMSLAVASGGTGATNPSAARQTLAAAASGDNSDITSLTRLSGVGINASVDTSVNRLNVKSSSVLFDNDGNGVQVVIDKAAVGDSAAVLYQTGYSGRASAGLLASDRYRIAVSADGSAFRQALDVDPGTGHVGLAGYAADTANALGVSGTSFLFNAVSDSCRFTFNKVAAPYDASLTFETGFSARALMGLLGSDAFQLKVSPDGARFLQAFVVDQTTGNTAFKALASAASYAVADLPGAANGAFAFASNGRKVGEGAGAGTGVMIVFSAGAWRRLSDESVVAA